MSRRGLAGLALALCLLAGCAGERGPTEYEATFLDLFDTVTTIKGYADSQEDFTAVVREARELLAEYHRLFDIYNDYEGLHNLKTVNDSAGLAPVEVEGPIIDLLLLCRELYEASGGGVNAAMGSVLTLWHQAREESIDDPARAHLPEAEALEAALAHISFDTVVIDEAASTVFLTDPDQRLDVGAVAKGYAAGQAAAALPEGMILSLGGNVCATGPKPDGSPWSVGIQDPDGSASDFLCTLSVERGAVVTSGDYQRYYTVDGIPYHHLIDPGTGWPARTFRAVTVLCADSGLADALSTALFVMDEEAGRDLLERYGGEALWVRADGSMTWTGGLDSYFRSPPRAEENTR